MTGPVVGDPRVALRAPELLRRFGAAGVISSADVHVARRLGRLGGEHDQRVLLAVALTVRALRAGSVCLVLADRGGMLVPESDEDPRPADDGGEPVAVGEDELPDHASWVAAVEASPLVGDGRPVRWLDGRLYLDRYWRAEQLLRREVDARLRAPVEGVDPLRVAAATARLFPAADEDRQRLAAAAAAHGRLTVLTGGPGTGKTTTVARMLAVLQAVAGGGLTIALAAPTGKAATRLEETVRAQLATLPAADRKRVGEPEAVTVHRLLGWRPDTRTRFRHDRDHRLPHDVVLIDETSMVSLPMMAALLEALRPQARLVLVGDPDQLASVEAGAVLGDLVARPAPVDLLPAAVAGSVPGDLPAGSGVREALRGGVVRLVVPRRYGNAIAGLARAVREGRADEVVALLREGRPEVEFVEPAGEVPTETEVRSVRADAERAGGDLIRAARAGDVGAALAALEFHRLLLAHRRGPFGVAHWAARVEAWSGAGRPGTPWYPGRPLLVTVNDRDTGLSNGDVGVVVADPAGPDGAVLAAFGDPARPVLVRPHRLPAVETVHAMTVHRAQGSQFRHVSVLLPTERSPLLTRELVYTALTRARERVRVVGGEAAVRAAVGRPVRRASGLRFG